MKTNPGPTDPDALSIKTPTESVPPPKKPRKGPTGGYHKGVSPTPQDAGWEELPESDDMDSDDPAGLKKRDP